MKYLQEEIIKEIYLRIASCPVAATDLSDADMQQS